MGAGPRTCTSISGVKSSWTSLYSGVFQLAVLKASSGRRDLEPTVPQVGPGRVLERDVELEVREVVAIVVEEGEEPSLEGQLCKLFK